MSSGTRWASLEVQWAPGAVREAGRLDPPVKLSIVKDLEDYATTGRGDVVPLTNYNPPQYRLHVSGWRVRFTIGWEVRVLYVLSVQPRGRAYR